MASPILDAEIVGELVRGRRIADGIRVRERRASLHLAQRTAAEAAGIDVSTLSRIESGTFTPRDDVKIRLAAVLAQEVSDLWQPLPIAEVRARAMEMVA